MQFDTCMGIRGILDDTQETLVYSLLDGDCLTDGAVGSKALGWGSYGAVIRVPLESRVHGIQVWTRVVVNAATLRRNRIDVGRAGDEDTGILITGSGMKKDEGSVNVNNFSLTHLSAILAHNVIQANLGTVAIGGDSCLSLGQLVGNLGGRDLFRVAVLIQDDQRLTVNLHHATDRCRVKLDEIEKLVLTEGSLTTDIRCLAQIFAEHRNLILGLVSQKGDTIIGNLDNHADFVAEATSTNDLDMVTGLEALAQTLVGNLNRLPLQITFGHLQGDNVSLNVGGSANNTPLFTLVDFDNIARDVSNACAAIPQAGSKSLEIQVLRAVLTAACEPGDFLETGVDVLSVELLDLDILDLKAMLKVFAHVGPGVGLRVTCYVSRMPLPSLDFAEETLRGSGARHSRTLPFSVRRHARVVSNAVIQSGNEPNAGLEAILGHVKNLRQISGMFGGLAQPHPRAGLQIGCLDDAQQIWHVLDFHQNHLGSRIDVEDALERDHDVVLSHSLDINVSLHDGIDAAPFKGRDDWQFVLGAEALLDAANNGEDDLTLLSFLTPDGPNAGILDTRHEQTAGLNSHVPESSGRSTFSVSLAQDFGLLLGVKASLHLSPAVQLAMSPIIVEAAAVGNVVGVGIVDEAFYIFAVLLLVLDFVFVVYFGFDIEEVDPSVSLALATMALYQWFVSKPE